MIPLFVTLTLTNPEEFQTRLEAPTVRLLRRIKFSSATQSDDVLDGFEYAVWWNAEDSGGRDCGFQVEKKMYGEIMLKKDLAPSMSVANFSLEVFSISLSLLPREPAIYRL